jgi:hypothetical protein
MVISSGAGGCGVSAEETVFHFEDAVKDVEGAMIVRDDDDAGALLMGDAAGRGGVEESDGGQQRVRVHARARFLVHHRKRTNENPARMLSVR